MRMHRVAIALALALVVGFVIRAGGAAEEDTGAHTKGTVHTIMVDNEDVRPSTTTMGPGDSIAFENFSSHPMIVTFTEPADLKTRIRCGLVRGKASDPERAPWALFSWEDGKMKGTIPPGRFASVCSFAAGTYTFLVDRQGPGAQAHPTGDLPEKGQIVVK